MKFEDVTERAGLAMKNYWGSGATFVDINGDDRLDLYVCHYRSHNELYINQGDGTFKESAQRYGLDFNGASLNAAFADFDGDGDLDVYLLTNRIYPVPGQDPGYRTRNLGGRLTVHPDDREKVYPIRKPDGSYLLAEAGQFDYMYRNNGDGTFEDVTDLVGMDSQAAYHGLSATWWDYDNDGDVDLYVTNDFWDPDYLYRNNGDGSFTNVIARSVPRTPWFSMGADAADINNDGVVNIVDAIAILAEDIHPPAAVTSTTANCGVAAATHIPQMERTHPVAGVNGVDVDAVGCG